MKNVKENKTLIKYLCILKLFNIYIEKKKKSELSFK